MEAHELAQMAKERGRAIEADSSAADLFVSMRFRPVYDDEPIDADVTAEVYQPTAQLCELAVQRGVVRDGGVVEGCGQVALEASSKLSFKIGPDTLPTADVTYFFARVHNLAKPYVPPPMGALRSNFPPANRGAALRKFHLRTFLSTQRKAGIPFEKTVADFQLLLHASSLLPSTSFDALCEAVASTGTTKSAKSKREKAIADAESRLRDAAGLSD
eukprot:CAMPEP_0115830574 /NCGR_PEP_ID=MMETSP0287-20121206/1686_1 /TAXON_ID=412157 /ORGANISM="Chrysochromulina rotalis, Strain UIO044" /LENGTH=215 /DNA_ID=CAMNT_0003283879 /DNA_START=15 /DNA_END=662 /DNA_ORIENTATION=-